MSSLISYIQVVRPRQWIKNTLVFFALFFSNAFFVGEKLWAVFMVAIVFILLSSAMYVVNDIFDKRQDALHPVKKERPIASGRITYKSAWIYASMLILISATLILFVENLKSVSLFFISYVILNILYSRYLKHLPVVELVVVSMFYLLRVFAGGAVIDVPISPWLSLCMFFVTLLIISAKRFSEMKHVARRKVVELYSEEFLRHLISLSAGLTLVSYGLYVVLGPQKEALEPMLFSVLFVVIAILRFIMIAFAQDTEFPEERLFKDSITLSAFALWFMTMYYTFYLT